MGTRQSAVITLIIALLTTGLGLTACATDSPAPGTPTTTGATMSTSPTPTSRSSTGEVTVRGVTKDGVEAGCVLLTPDAGGPDYLLLGGDRAIIEAGGHLEVTGRQNPDLLSYCQQGTAFEVSSVRKL